MFVVDVGISLQISHSIVTKINGAVSIFCIYIARACKHEPKVRNLMGFM